MKSLAAEEGGTTNLLQRLKFLSGFKANSLPGRDRHFGSRSGIASYARFARADIENTKAAKFDTLSLRQRPFHALKNGFHSHFGFGLRDAGPVHNFINDIELDQDNLPSDKQLTRADSLRQVSDRSKPHDRIRVIKLSRRPI